MPLKLKTVKTIPKNGFVYVQPETSHPLGGMFSFSYVTDQIVAHRKGNKLSRATKDEASEDLENYTLGLHPELGYDPGHIVPENQRQAVGCSTCGIKVL